MGWHNPTAVEDVCFPFDFVSDFVLWCLCTTPISSSIYKSGNRLRFYKKTWTNLMLLKDVMKRAEMKTSIYQQDVQHKISACLPMVSFHLVSILNWRDHISGQDGSELSIPLWPSISLWNCQKRSYLFVMSFCTSIYIPCGLSQNNSEHSSILHCQYLKTSLTLQRQCKRE